MNTYKLTIHHDKGSWTATLAPHPAATDDTAGPRADSVRHFTSPLSLLEWLEAQQSRPPNLHDLP